MRLTKVVSFCLGDIPSARIGIVEPMLELQKEGLIEFNFYLAAQLTREILADADVIISIRSADSYELNIVKECKQAGKLMIYYLDDDLLNIPQYAASTEYFNSDLVKSNIASIMGNCDYLLTNNNRINDKYASYVQKGAFIVKAPALLINEVVSRSIPTQIKDTIKIGFSGGTDHKANLELFLQGPFQQLKCIYGERIQFEFMGAKPDFSEDIGYKHIPYQSDYNSYIQLMCKNDWDIAVAPLPDSDFHASKYYNKFLEYGAVGAAGVYSDVEPYRQIVQHQVNGLLVENTDEAWVESISRLIDDSLLRLNIQRNARKQLEDEFTTAQIAMDISDKLKVLVTYRSPNCKPKSLNLNLGSKELLFSKLNNIMKSMGIINGTGYIYKKSIHKLFGVKKQPTTQKSNEGRDEF